MNEEFGFDTGDNVDHGTNCLYGRVAALARLGYSPILAILDLATELKGSPRVFAYKMRDRFGGDRFYLVARSTDWYRFGGEEWFGSQLWFVRKVAAEDKPLVLAMPSGYFVFDAAVLLDGMGGTNQRQGATMGNFKRSLGLPWDPSKQRLFPIFREIMIRNL